MIAFGPELRDRAFARKKEFLLVCNGAWASSSLAGNTRKYHGLLVAGGRVLLSSLDEHLNGEPLTPAAYAGGTDDRGLSRLYGFCLDPDPVFSYASGGVLLRKRLSFDGALTVRYDLAGPGEVRIAPLVADRGIHETRTAYDLAALPVPGGVRVGPITLRSQEMAFVPGPCLYRDVLYEEDRERGYAHREHLFSPGCFTAAGEDCTFTLTVEAENVRRCPIRKSSDDEWLERAADSFIYGDEILAGYHWFAEGWGRDTFVSLPGLLLARGRYAEARRIFARYAGRLKGGLIPNRMPDDYASSDAPLWFLHALERYRACTRDDRFVAEMRPHIEAILLNYPESAVAHLDGALIAVAPRSTWMDTSNTPRAGKPVEINALWIAALRFGESLGIEGPVPAHVAQDAFSRFWNHDRGCFFDLLDPNDPSVRPNQAIALALGIPPAEQGRSALGVIREELLTPVGLRTLSPLERGYAGRFAGDATYHNGTVWPWLLPFYLDALRIYAPGADPAVLFAPLSVHLADAGLGTVSECFDGDPPHRPRGCISQAWSVAGMVRAYRGLSSGGDTGAA
jgi:glycogen debranching enzyme